MISFDLDTCRFNLRVAGLAFHREHVLLHRATHELFWTAPGGRCEPLEYSEATVRREFAEELGVEIRVDRLLALVENLFEYEGRKCHELCFYYSVTLPENSPLLDLDARIAAVDAGVELEFRWFPVVSLDALEIRPTCLVDIVRGANACDGVRHIEHAG